MVYFRTNYIVRIVVVIAADRDEMEKRGAANSGGSIMLGHHVNLDWQKSQ